MRAEIDALIAGLESEDETGDKVWHQKGDGVVIIKRVQSEGGEAEDARIIVRSDTTDEDTRADHVIKRRHKRFGGRGIS